MITWPVVEPEFVQVALYDMVIGSHHRLEFLVGHVGDVTDTGGADQLLGAWEYALKGKSVKPP